MNANIGQTVAVVLYALRFKQGYFPRMCEDFSICLILKLIDEKCAKPNSNYSKLFIQYSSFMVYWNQIADFDTFNHSASFNFLQYLIISKPLFFLSTISKHISYVNTTSDHCCYHHKPLYFLWTFSVFPNVQCCIFYIPSQLILFVFFHANTTCYDFLWYTHKHICTYFEFPVPRIIHKRWCWIKLS